MKRVRGKRGVMDSVTLPFLLFFMALFLVIVIWVAQTMVAPLENFGAGFAGGSVGQAVDVLQSIPAMANVLFVLGLIGYALVFIMLSAMVPTHPMLAFVMVPVMILGIYFGAHLANSWDSFDLASTGSLKTALDSAPMIRQGMGHLVEYFVGVAIIGGMVFYGFSKKNPGSDAGGFGP